MSPSKTVQNAALWPLIADGRLPLASHVADYLPGFGARGKSAITIEQVMLHTSGLAGAPLPCKQTDGGAV